MSVVGPRYRARGDDGVAVIWVLALSCLLLVLLAAGAVVADLVAARQRAAAAADLAALAAAPAAAYGDDNACRVAAAVVRDNGAVLVECRVADSEVWVTASASPRARWTRSLLGTLDRPVEPRATAHAGLR